MSLRIGRDMRPRRTGGWRQQQIAEQARSRSRTPPRVDSEPVTPLVCGLLEEWGLGILSSPRLVRHIRNYCDGPSPVENFAHLVAACGGTNGDTNGTYRNLARLLIRGGVAKQLLHSVDGGTINTCIPP